MITVLILSLSALAALVSILITGLFVWKTNQKLNFQQEQRKATLASSEEMLKIQTVLTTLDTKQSDLRDQFRAFADKITIEQTTNQELNKNFQTLGANYHKLLTNLTTIDNKLENTSQDNRRLTEQFDDLTKVFFNSSRRGSSGETTLNYILHAVFGNNAKVVNTQYQMKNGKRADVFIHAPQSNIPIDSKFPLINTEALFNPRNDDERRTTLSDLKTKLRKHIQDVSKYVSEKDNTAVALLYLPSQPLFEFIYANNDLSNLDRFAHQHKVYLVGPNTLPIVLQIINKVIERHNIQKNIKQILQLLQHFQKDWQRLQERFAGINKNFGTFETNFHRFQISFEKISKKLTRILLANPHKDDSADQTSFPPSSTLNNAVPTNSLSPLESDESDVS